MDEMERTTVGDLVYMFDGYRDDVPVLILFDHTEKLDWTFTLFEQVSDGSLVLFFHPRDKSFAEETENK